MGGWDESAGGWVGGKRSLGVTYLVADFGEDHGEDGQGVLGLAFLVRRLLG